MKVKFHQVYKMSQNMALVSITYRLMLFIIILHKKIIMLKENRIDIKQDFMI